MAISVIVGSPSLNGGKYSAPALSTALSGIPFPLALNIANLTNKPICFPDIGLTLSPNDVFGLKSTLVVIPNADILLRLGNYIDYIAGALAVATLLSISLFISPGNDPIPALDETITIKAPTTITASSYTVSLVDSALIFNTTATHTLTLPPATANSGRVIDLKNTAAFAINSATANVVPMNSNNPGTAILAATAGKCIELISDGTNWVSILGN